MQQSGKQETLFFTKSNKIMTFQFRIQIKEISKPPVWRTILVPSNSTFNQFHDAIQVAFGWTNTHLYSFSERGYSNDITISIPSEDDWGPVIDSRRTLLKDIFEFEAQRFIYIYDFNNDWHHKITLEKIIDDEISVYSCINGRGSCPPEDCGGVWGYEELKQNFPRASKSEREELRNYYGMEKEKEWDAKYFSLEDINKQLKIVYESHQNNVVKKQHRVQNKAKSPLSPSMPEFNHSVISVLYEYSSNIDRNTLHAITILPRKTLVEDMQNILKRCVQNPYHYMLDNGGDDTTKSAPIHALYMLSSLRSEESLDFFMNTMNNGGLEVDIFDYVSDDLWEFIYWMGQNQLNKLKEFILSPNISQLIRNSISQAVLQIALYNPTKEQKVIDWYVNVIEHLLDKINDREGLDSKLLEQLVLDFMVLGNKNHLPLIKSCLKTGKLSQKEIGTIDELSSILENESSKEMNKWELHSTIDQFYDEWAEWDVVDTDF